MPGQLKSNISPGLFEEKFIHAAGKGGQNINKLSTAVQLRVKISSLSLPQWVLDNIRKNFGQSYLAEGDILLSCDVHRTQLKNRVEIKKRFFRIWDQCWKKPRVRKATRPSFQSVKNRLESKKKRGQIKKDRSASWD